MDADGNQVLKRLVADMLIGQVVHLFGQACAPSEPQPTGESISLQDFGATICPFFAFEIFAIQFPECLLLQSSAFCQIGLKYL